jgi:hypothetical protein
VRTELVSASEASALLEKIIALRDPELAATRKKNAAERRRILRYGKRVPPRDMTEASYIQSGMFDYIVEYKGQRFGNRLALTSSELVPQLLNGLNREFSETRRAEYRQAMLDGKWLDTPDPIAITEDGHLINGQHRLAAALSIRFEKGDKVPVFVVVWGVSKQAALVMDEARRSTDDRRGIALKYAEAVATQ